MPVPLEVLQYRKWENNDYVYVQWDNGKQTWIPATNLKSNALIDFFLEKCKSLLGERYAEENKIREHEREEKLFQKLMNKNPAKRKEESEQNKKANEFPFIVKASKADGNNMSKAGGNSMSKADGSNIKVENIRMNNAGDAKADGGCPGAADIGTKLERRVPKNGENIKNTLGGPIEMGDCHALEKTNFHPLETTIPVPPFKQKRESAEYSEQLKKMAKNLQSPEIEYSHTATIEGGLAAGRARPGTEGWSIRIKIGESELFTFKIYCENRSKTSTVQMETVVFVPYGQILGALRKLDADSRKVFLPEVEANDKEYDLFCSALRRERKFASFVLLDRVWVFYVPAENEQFLEIGHQQKAGLFMIQDARGCAPDGKAAPQDAAEDVRSNLRDGRSSFGFLQHGIYKVRGEEWATKKIWAGVHNYSRYLFRKCTLESKRPMCVVGRRSSYMLRHLKTFLREDAELIDRPVDRSCLVIDYGYLDYLHQISGIEGIMMKDVEFYVLKSFSLKRIMKQKGIFELEKDFLSDVPVLDVVAFICEVSRRGSWAIAARGEAYKVFQAKTRDVGKAHAAQLSICYNMLRNTMGEFEDFPANFEAINPLWKKYKYYYLLGSEAGGECITLEKAYSLIREAPV